MGVPGCLFLVANGIIAMVFGSEQEVLLSYADISWARWLQLNIRPGLLHIKTMVKSNVYRTMSNLKRIMIETDS
jgi:hypothetical protein